MKTIEINLYSFDELSEEVQKEVLLKYSDINTDYDWFASTLQNQKEEEKDFSITEIYFSGFSSQGDGAMFEYDSIIESFYFSIIDDLKLPEWKKRVLKKFSYISASGKHSGHYNHEKSVAHNINIETDNGAQYYDNIENLVSSYAGEIESEIIRLYQIKARAIYNKLEKEYYSLITDEAIKETFEANSYTFEANGKMRNV